MPGKEPRDRSQEGPPQQAKQHQEHHRREHPGRGLVGVLGRFASRRTQEHDAGEAYEGDRGQASDQGEDADRQEGRQAATAGRGQARTSSGSGTRAIR